MLWKYTIINLKKKQGTEQEVLSRLILQIEHQTIIKAYHQVEVKYLFNNNIKMPETPLIIFQVIPTLLETGKETVSMLRI
jgi:hypothetical protein